MGSNLILGGRDTSQDVVRGLSWAEGRYFAIKRSWDVPFCALKDAQMADLARFWTFLDFYEAIWAHT